MRISLQSNLKFVMPANAGIQVHPRFRYNEAWIPACAGMTEGQSTFGGNVWRQENLSTGGILP